MKGLIFVLMLIASSAFAQDNSTLVGTLEGTDRTDTLSFVFEPDSIITMVNKTDKETIGGRETTRKGRVVQLI